MYIHIVEGVFILEILTKKQQIQNWKNLYDKQISEQEFAEICDSLNGFFTTLKQWDEEERTKLENERLSNIGNSDSYSQAS